MLRSQTKVLLDDDYPKYMDRKIQRLDSMDFSPNSMMKDIQNAIQMNDAKKVSGRDRKVLNRRKLLHMPTTCVGDSSSRNNSLLDRGGSSHEVAHPGPLDNIKEEQSHKGG